MKIVNFQSFMEFANEMETRYKFYRVVDDKIQCYMFGRDGIVINSETKSNQKIILDIVSKGFIETKLTKEEIELMRL